MIKYIYLLFVLIIFIVSGCSSVKTGARSDAPTLMACPEERPEMCTMQYDPVCAKLLDGSLQTFSNSCNACADKQAVAYQHGECK